MAEEKTLSSKELFKQYMKTRTTLERNLTLDDKQKLQQKIDNIEYNYNKKKEKQRDKYHSDEAYKKKILENSKRLYDAKMKAKNMTKNKQQYESEYSVLDLDDDNKDNNNNDNINDNIEVEDVVKPKIDYRRLV
jgi:hypothetical protein